MKTVQETAECTTFSVNVNVHIASRFRLDVHSSNVTVNRCPGFFFWLFTADSRTHTTTLVHHHFLHAFSRFLRSGDIPWLLFIRRYTNELIDWL